MASSGFRNLPEMTLELCRTHRSREGNDVADVINSREVHDETFEAQPVTGMMRTAILTQFQICLLYTSPSPRDS